MPRGEYLEFKIKSMSLIHGTVISLLSGYHWTRHQAECSKEPDGFEYLIIVILSGYFTVDTLIRQWFGILDAFVIFHHSICAICALFTLIDETNYVLFVVGTFVAEFSNPM